ncbi:MAG TPA: chemotaxis protein MotB [Myxococcales bacterium]|nr:chemotaxis protein MotB [Deltaproteobacteria bacterium]MBU47233.1 chemotaxis protein MotB [Deltaproteobacteria bacterium]HAA55158.1 chemotaxis protein MotB [Myxococcales bacterium]|tara:strand:- start:6518 stop:7222 length:705 start_codon:yes stop_codon:yes gene_type:complete
MTGFQTQFSLEERQENPFWQSIGDLMASLLLIFVLLLLLVLYQMYKSQEKQQSTRNELLSELQQTLKRAHIDVVVDRQNGTITIKDNILFAYGKSNLSDEGRSFLSRFIPVYTKVLFSRKDFRKEIVRIVVEGHTDRSGRFDINLRLSLNRALGVTNFLLSEDLLYTYKDELKKRLLCSGRGELDANKSEAKASDRKVIFRIQFRDLQFLDIWGKLVLQSRKKTAPINPKDESK